MFSVHSLEPGAVTSASHEVFTYNCHRSQNRQRRPPTPPLTAHLLPLGAPARDHGGWGHSPSQTGRACKVAGEGSGQVAWELTKSLLVERPAQSPFLPCRPLGGHLPSVPQAHHPPSAQTPTSHLHHWDPWLAGSGRAQRQESGRRERPVLLPCVRTTRLLLLGPRSTPSIPAVRWTLPLVIPAAGTP